MSSPEDSSTQFVTSTSVPPPASPFEPRPSAGDAAKNGMSSSAGATRAPPAGKFLPIEYPLTSFANTPHNIAAISFLLGGLFTVGALLASSLLLKPFLSWSTPPSTAHLSDATFWAGLTSPLLGIYLACWATFHLMEFMVTSIWNPAKLSVSSFLLDNGKAYHVAHAIGIAEYVLEEYLLPDRYRAFKHSGPLVLLGFAVIVLGQVLRSGAMITASSNFSHIVAYSKLPSHQLVTSGIYAWSRHPSYAGFTWWALGTQIFLGNPVSFAAFSVVLYYFFSRRIREEERLLTKFFGDDYVAYKAKVPTRILFIP